MTRDITPAGSPATGAVDEAFAEVRASFDRFCLAAGIEALGTMMEADVTAACGPRHGRDAARRAHRWGRTRGGIGFHGGKIEVERPRVRGVDGREVTIPSWMRLPEWERIGAVYDFVRDCIALGYNESDDLPASRVLADGYGQCNTKATLLMAFLRACGIPCRLHGAKIHKRLQKGVVSGLFYRLAPTDIVHSWAEVFHQGQWIALEGVILDLDYLSGLRAMLPPATRAFVGFAVGTDDLRDPPIAWNGTDTFIQIKGVNRDFGVYDDPASFYAQRGTNLRGIRRLLFKHVVRHIMNARVRSIRASSSSGVTAASANKGVTTSPAESPQLQ